MLDQSAQFLCITSVTGLVFDTCVSKKWRCKDINELIQILLEGVVRVDEWAY